MTPRPRILVTDDDPDIGRRLLGLLGGEYEVRVADRGDEALAVLSGWPPAIVLLDVVMPGLDGLETCRRIKRAGRQPTPQVVMLSGRDNPLDLESAFAHGADDYLPKPIQADELRSRVCLNARLYASRQETLRLQAEVDSKHQELRDAAREQLDQVVAVQDVTLLALAKLAEARDDHTGEHIARMREYAHRIALQLQSDGRFPEEVTDEFVDDVYRSAPLHDIGKVAIADSILLKPGGLTDEEMQAMQLHAVFGANLLHKVIVQSRVGGFLTMAALIARFHHERWDGGGYPAGLRGEEIPLAARIVAVADVFDALTSDRPYKSAWPPELARENILENAGAQFDPAVAAAFDACFGDLLEIRARYAAREEHAVGAMAFLQQATLEAS